MKSTPLKENSKKKMININSQRKMFAFCFLSAFLLFCVLISPVSAKADWKFSPDTPTVGDVIKIKGTATPNEEIHGMISFETNVSVNNGKYEYVLEDIQIPEGFNNYFSVRAEGVENLTVAVKKLVWINLTADAVDGNATISQGHVPPLSYLIVLSGDALEGNDAVLLNFTATQTFSADSKGKFEYEYDTTSIPAGFFKIKIGELEQIIELKPLPDFSASPLSGKAPLEVTFTDESEGVPSVWEWDFGDGTGSAEQNPVHIYDKTGKYTVSLRVATSEGVNASVDKSKYITVEKKEKPGNPEKPEKSEKPGKVEVEAEMEEDVQSTDNSESSPSEAWHAIENVFIKVKNLVKV